MAKKKSTKTASSNGAENLACSLGKPIVTRLREFLQNFHDTEQYAKDRAFCFIIGSGAAHTAGIPTGASLVNRWLVEMHDMDDACEKRILPPHAKINFYAESLLEGESGRLKVWSEKRFAYLSGFSFEERARFYGHIYKARFESDQNLGQQFLRELIHRRKPSIGFHLLARILNRTRHNVVITTNFDHLVEDSIAITENEAVQSFNHAGLAEFVQSRPEHPAVAKIHGDILLKSFNAAEELDQLSDEWTKALKSLFQTYTPIVIGYGGNDPGFMKFLLDEMKTWGDDRRCYWFVRKQSKFQNIPSCAELGQIKALRLVECPGFTELMLKLNEIFDFKLLHEELRERADLIAAELRESDTKARGDLADHERRSRIAQSEGGTTNVKSSENGANPTQTLPPSPPTWRTWRDKLAECTSAQSRRIVLAEALQAFPGNLPIQAAAAVYSMREWPVDKASLELIQKLLRQSELETGPESDETLAVMHSLATALLKTNEPEKAEALYRRIIADRQRVLGAEHRDTLASRNNLAHTLNDQGKNTDAEQEFREVLKLEERVLGAEHPHTLASRMNLANSLQVQGKYSEAEQEHRAVLQIQMRLLGAEHRDTLGSRMNLANALDAQRKHAEAEREHRAVLKLRERVLGVEHPDVAISCYNLALCLEDQKKLPEAFGFMQRAEQVWTKVLGSDHLDTRDAKAARERIEAAVAQQKSDQIPNQPNQEAN